MTWYMTWYELIWHDECFVLFLDLSFSDSVSFETGAYVFHDGNLLWTAGAFGSLVEHGDLLVGMLNLTVFFVSIVFFDEVLFWFYFKFMNQKVICFFLKKIYFFFQFWIDPLPSVNSESWLWWPFGSSEKWCVTCHQRNVTFYLLRKDGWMVGHMT